MSTKKSSTRKLTASQLRAFRSQVAALKRKGLVSPKIDARSQKPTRYMLEQVKKYADVLNGHATVLKVPKDVRDELKSAYAVKRGRVVIPTTGSETAHYSKKRGVTKTTRIGKNKGTVRVHVYENLDQLRVKEGPGVRYAVPFAGGQRYRFEKFDELYRFMKEGYASYKEWWRYVELEEWSLAAENAEAAKR